MAANDADSMLANIDSLKDTLPAVASETHLPHEDHDYRVRRLSPFAIVSGVVGTLMGWFTQRHLNNLRDWLDEILDQQNRLLHIQAIQLHQMDDIEANVQWLYSALRTGHTAWINYSLLEYARSQLRNNLHKLVRALQAAHYRCLSLDLLPSDKLKKLFDTANRKARSHHQQLLLRHLSDLLQIKTSHLHDGHDVHLILHIPMAPSESLLHLFQLRPFPVPFTDTHMLLPSPSDQILAISANTECLSIELSAIHLLGCHRVNQVYLYERNGVLKRHLNDTCLGSLYMQDLQGASSLCKLNILPNAEMVLQLHDNWYLIYSPEPLTSHIDCLNSSVSEIFIRRGASHIHVSPSCRLHLTSHMLISNFALQLDTVIKHYKWDLGRIEFSLDEQAHSIEWLATAEESFSKATLTSIRHSLAAEKRSSIWSFIFGLLGTTVVISVLIFLGYAVLT
jgi:hypothetical protein